MDMEVPRPPVDNEVARRRKEKAKLRLAIIAVAVVIVAGIFWYFERSFILPFQQVASFESSLSYKLAENFSAPAPLKQIPTGSAKNSNRLTVEGVIVNTNGQRAANGNLPALAENSTLDAIATLRLDDMFADQYFAHVNPVSKSSAQTVASSVGYSYLALGENLALGNFAGDTGVVTAWMNSPGHRANILDVHYTQIGVAVREGDFQGQETWIAVQVFGKPSSDCVSPDPALKGNIDSSEMQISTLAAQIQQSKSDIDAMQPQSGSDYNAAVATYNALVTQYNGLVSQTKAAIAQYDSEISAFNTCLSG